MMINKNFESEKDLSKIYKDESAGLESSASQNPFSTFKHNWVCGACTYPLEDLHLYKDAIKKN